MEDEAHKLGLRVAHHVGVEETNAWDDIHFGTTSIEHWYGIPDAAIEAGVQNFPSTITTTTRPIASATPATSGARPIPNVSPRCLSHGGAPRGVGPDARHLRGQPRPAARADAAMVRRLSAPRAGRVLQARTRPIMVRTSSAGPPPTRSTGRKITASGWRRCASSTGWAG